jgi:hypothetical protein
MPDLDLVPRGLTRGWRRPYRIATAGGNASELADAVGKATAATLREVGGCPRLPEVLALFKRTLHRKDLSKWEKASSDVRTENLSGHLDLLIEAGNRLFQSEGILEDFSEDQAAIRLVEEFLVCSIDSYFFGRIRNALIKERFSTVSEFEDFRRAVLDDIDLTELARRLLRHPDGTKVRAPARSRKDATVILLHEPIA